MAKILIVDDSNMVRDMLRYTLTSSGFSEIVDAVDGVDGLEKAKAAQFDLVITDVNMINMNGLELIQNLRQIPSYTATPILVLTTEKDGDMKTKGKAVGATGWIVKPFSPEQIVKAVNMVLKR